MWQIFMLVPVVNDGSPVQEGLRRGRVLRARGMVRIDEMFVEQKEQKPEAIRECLRLAQQTIMDKGYDTTVVGFGVRHRRAKKSSKLEWQCTLQQVHETMERIYEKRGCKLRVAG